MEHGFRVSSRVEIKDVTKEYGTKVALLGISLVGESGTFTLLLSPLGLDDFAPMPRRQPTRGTLTVADKVAAGLSDYIAPKKHNLTIVFPGYAHWPHFTVLKNIVFLLKNS